MKNVNLKLVIALSILSAPTMIDSLVGTSISKVYASEIKTKRVPALRNKVYTQLARAQKLADEGQVAQGLEALDNVKARSSSMNSYEIAMMHNFYGFIYYNENRISEARQAFEDLVAQDPIPESLKLNTLFSLAQIAMNQEDYDSVISYLDKWKSINTGKVTANYYELLANANYQNGQYDDVLVNVNRAIQTAKINDKPVKESWYILLRAAHYELKQPNEVVKVLEKMTLMFDKPEYWVQLAAMYGEVGNDKDQLAIIETVKQRGELDSKDRIQMLSQIYMLNGLSYKAAQTMAYGIDKQLIDENVKNVAFIAEAFIQAKEDKQSLPYFKKAAIDSETGVYDRRLAEVYLNLEMYDEAADSARAALDKGGLRFESNAYIALGMAQYNLENFDAAILAFEQAEQHTNARQMAKQWIKFVKSEKLHKDTLASYL